MLTLIEANWPIVALIAAVAVVLVLLLLRRRRPERRRYHAPDALDEGAAPAQRNQAFIDAIPVAAVEPVHLPPVTVSPVPGDDLGRIKGLGPKLQALLPALGVTSFAQIASWNEDDLIKIDAQLGAFAGRPQRDNWIEQAKFLAAEDVAGFEAKFGKV